MQMSPGWSEYTQSWDSPEDTQAVWPITTLQIAADSELILTGDSSGRLTTYTLGLRDEPLDRQTSFLCSHTPVRNIHSLPLSCNLNNSNVDSHTARALIVTDDTVQMRTFGGHKLWAKSTTPTDPFTTSALGLEDMQNALVCTSAGAGSLINMQRGSVVRRITLEPSALVARLDSRNLWLATASGSLVRRDARAGFTVAQSTRAFSSAISDAVFVNDTYAISCGSVVDPQNAYNVVADNTVKVFDMRNLGSTPAETIDCDESATPIKLALAEQSKSTLWVCYDSGYVETRVHGAGSDWTKIGDAYAEPVFNGEYTYTSAFCVAPTAQATIVADTEGILHVWAESSSEIQSTPQLSISGNTCVDVVATAKEKPPIGVNFDDESVSLSCIGGLDILDEPLLSCMDNVCLYDVGRPVNFVDPETTVNLRKIDAVGYMFNPRKTRRNQQVFGRTWRKQWKEGMQSSKDDELTQGRSRFLSQQQRRPQPQLQSQSQSQSQHPHRSSQQQQQQHRQAQLSQTGGSPMAEAAHLPTGISRTALSSSPIQRASTPSGISASISAAASAASAAVAAGGQSSILSSSKTPPKHLQQMRIAYSRFGVEDFDFSLYNSTRFSGLEGGVTNKYANSLLQTMFFIPELRTLALSHCASDCMETNCLSCQLGFLFRMLETAEGASCHASQLLHVLADRPEAAALALLEDEHGHPANGSTYTVLAQRLLRFMLEQASTECAALSTPQSTFTRNDPQCGARAVESIIGFEQATHSTCPHCRHTQSRSSHVFAAELDPPQGTSGLATLLAGGSVSARRAEMMRSGKRVGVLQLFSQALAKSETTRAWCSECRKYQLLQTEKNMTAVPSGYLALNFPVVDTPSTLSTTSTMTAAGAATTSAATATAGASATAPVATAAGNADTGALSPWQMVLPREFRLGVSDVEGALGKRIRVLPPKIIADSVAPTKNTDGGDTNATATDGADTSIQTEDGEEGENEDEDESALHTFELVAVVSGIRDTARDREHLVVHVRDPSNPNGWLLFNDFLVQPVPEVSVVSLHDWWRTPSIAIYANSNRSDLTRCISQIVKQHPYKINTRILTSPKSILDRMLPGTSMSPNRRGNNLAKSGTAANTRVSSGQRNSAVPLTRAEAEMLEKGEFICALDAEFVVLEAAKMEVFSDGTQQLYQAPVYTLARLSVVRANGGLLHGLPFIDDYVAVTRPINDLATQYSGIHAGDLTIGTSRYKLSTMKEVYKKLRLLIDSNCTIIGHGLKHDFRVCNIVVPTRLQHDTMVLFQAPPRYIRPIALKFLYWFFYHESIQTGEHSSVEDAQATLKVYESYVTSIREDPDNSIDSVLDMLYNIGGQLLWKTPTSNNPTKKE